ncbi:MAG: aminoacyl-tRNA hydrolase [Spirochaetes bacterium]|nr:aminoacyl-tRNA hydrolase [Spirochaetota bacterium]
MVFGLGNPGERYAQTRHNAGFMAADALAESAGVSFRKKLFHAYLIGKGSRGGRSFHLVKPLTFMNNSGRVVREVLRETEHTVADMLVVCDSLDLAPGSCRLRLRGSSGGQKGLESIIQTLGTQDFMRLAIGIGRPAHKGQVIPYVLSRPLAVEEEEFGRGVEKAVEAVFLLLSDGPARVMNEHNRKEPHD